MITRSLSWRALIRIVPRRLAGTAPHLGRFEAVVQAIAQDMDQRVGQRLDDILVGLGILALEHQLHVLAELV
jgi:hypothetical protein